MGIQHDSLSREPWGALSNQKMFSYLPAPREHLLIYTETPYSLELAPRSTPQVGCLESQVARVESQASFHHLAWCACSWGGRGRAQWGRQVGRWGGGMGSTEEVVRGRGRTAPALPLEVQLLWSHHSNPPSQPLSLLFPTMEWILWSESLLLACMLFSLLPLTVCFLKIVTIREVCPSFLVASPAP